MSDFQRMPLLSKLVGGSQILEFTAQLKNIGTNQ